MVFHLRAGEDAIGDDLVDLLRETGTEVAQGGTVEGLKHHDGLGMIGGGSGGGVGIGVLEDGVVGQMDFFVQFGQSVCLVGEAAVACVVSIDNWSSLVG